MKGALRIGSLSGIGVYIHWTFSFILLYFAYQIVAEGGDMWAVGRGELFLLLLYVCVVLHEMGHALAARKYGIDTLHIVLYPIGGVASLERIPEKPFEEFVVAIAGPMVNVGIALGLGLYIYLFAGVPRAEEELSRFIDVFNTFDNFVFTLMLTNVLLVGFNILPAFPMDGGRVLRSLLSMKIGRVKATKIASAIGQIFAILFVAWGFLGASFQPFMVLIGFFVYVAAVSENQMVHTQAHLKGFKVKDVMQTQFTTLNKNETLVDAIKVLLANAQDDFVVIEEGKPIGILFRKRLMKAVKEKATDNIADIIVQNNLTIRPEQDIQKIFQVMQQKRLYILPVVDENGDLIGVLDRRNLSDFIAVQDLTKSR